MKENVALWEEDFLIAVAVEEAAADEKKRKSKKKPPQGSGCLVAVLAIVLGIVLLGIFILI